MEGFPLDINIGDIRPRVGSAKKAIAGNGTKFGRLGDPQGVAVSEEGNVIVSDSRNHRLQVGKLNFCQALQKMYVNKLRVCTFLSFFASVFREKL